MSKNLQYIKNKKDYENKKVEIDPDKLVRCLDKNTSGQIYQQLYYVKDKSIDDYQLRLYRDSVVLLYPDYRYGQIQGCNPEQKTYLIQLLREDENKNLLKDNKWTITKPSEIIWELPTPSSRILSPYRDLWLNKIPDLSVSGYLEESGKVWLVLLVICILITLLMKGDDFLIMVYVFSALESYGLYYLLFNKYATMSEKTYDGRMMLVGIILPPILLFLNFLLAAILFS